MSNDAKKWPQGAYVYSTGEELLFFSQITPVSLPGSIAAYPWHKRDLVSTTAEQAGALVRELLSKSRYAVSESDFLTNYQDKDPLLEAFEVHPKKLAKAVSRCGRVTVCTGWDHTHLHITPTKLSVRSGRPLEGEFPPILIDCGDEALGKLVLERLALSRHANGL